MDPAFPDLEDLSAPLPVNWALRFIHNQLFKYFEFPSRFCPGAFHSTILRKAEFRSREVRFSIFHQYKRDLQHAILSQTRFIGGGKEQGGILQEVRRSYPKMEGYWTQAAQQRWLGCKW